VAVPGEISGERLHMHRACVRVSGHVHGGTHLCLHVEKSLEEQYNPRADQTWTKTSEFTV
jgi:hypothetical protein